MCQISLILFLKANHNIWHGKDCIPGLCQISLILFLKANHNLGFRFQYENVVSNIVNSVFESKPQLGNPLRGLDNVVSNIVNSVFESKPQLAIRKKHRTSLLCQISLILFLKANHNLNHNNNQSIEVVSNIVNSVFESKPQLLTAYKITIFSCVKYR